MYKRDKEGNITYQSRFFIPENIEELLKDCEDDNNELKKTIEYQQNIIEKCTEHIKSFELEKIEMYEKITTYEDLLQKSRYKLKELSIENREFKEKINTYMLLNMYIDLFIYLIYLFI